jgi:hypothetical protein
MTGTTVDPELVTLDAVKDELEIDRTDTSKDDLFKRLRTRARDLIEDELNQPVIAPTLPITVQFDIEEWDVLRLWLPVVPVIAITSIHESYQQQWTDENKLTEGSQYLLDKATGCLDRIFGTAPVFGSAASFWAFGLRTVQIVYRGGYEDDATKSNVPGRAQDVCLRLIATMYREIERKAQGTTARKTLQNPGGAIQSRDTWLADSHLTDNMKDQLFSLKRVPRRAGYRFHMV